MPIPAKPERPDISAPSYGMGWVIDSYRGHRRLQHGGGIDGFITSVMFFPDDDLGVVTFTNVGSGLPSLLAQHAADRVLGLEPVDWSGDALEQVKKAREAAKTAGKNKDAARRQGTHPSHAIAEYPGEYAHPGYGTLRIEAGKGEDLYATINDIKAPLEHWHYDVWSGADAGEGDPTFEDRKFLFETDFEGNVAAVETIVDDIAGPVTFTRRADPRLSDPEYLTPLRRHLHVHDHGRDRGGGGDRRRAHRERRGSAALHVGAGHRRQVQPEERAGHQDRVRGGCGGEGEQGDLLSARGHVRGDQDSLTPVVKRLRSLS